MMAEAQEAWPKLKNAFSRNFRLSLYVIAAGGWIVGMTKLVSVFKVSGSSMLPHLQAGDWVVAESISTRFFPDKYPITIGDVVVVKSPVELEKKLLKRVIALEGDIVPNKKGIRLANSYDHDGDSIRVPPNSMWLEGDNKYSSIDSRDYGPVAKQLLQYRVAFKFYPSFTRLSDPWLVRLLNGDVLWTPKNAPPTKPTQA